MASDSPSALLTTVPPDKGMRMSILNAACSGKFSSDRAIRKSCDEISTVKPLKVNL